MIKLTLKNIKNYSTNQDVLNLLKKRLKEEVELYAIQSDPGSLKIQYCCSLDAGFTAVKTKPTQFN